MAGKKAVRLKTVGDVSQFLAKLINEVRRGEINERTATKLGYLANILVSTIKDAELEERIQRLERKFGVEGESK